MRQFQAMLIRGALARNPTVLCAARELGLDRAHLFTLMCSLGLKHEVPAKDRQGISRRGWRRASAVIFRAKKHAA